MDQAVLITDHPRLNQLLDMMLAHLRMTQQGITIEALDPVGRLGNAAIFGATVGARLLNMDSLPLVLRWLRDMADGQFPEGGFPTVVPAPPGEEALCGEGPAGSSAAFVEVLWQVYRHCGDRQLLRRYFPAVKQMLAGGLKVARDFIREDLEAASCYPEDLAATAWFYRSARLGARIAGVLGNLTDLEDCEELASNIRNAFRRRFVTQDGRVIGDGPAVYALVLGFGLLDRSEQRRARRTLIDSCESVLRAGLADRLNMLGHPMLLPVLTEQGRLDLAYRLVLSTPVEPDPHQAGRDLGRLIGAGVHEWLNATLSGFNLSRDLSERRNAFRHMLIQPRPPLGLDFGGPGGEPPVRVVEAELATINGRFESSWRITDHAFELQVLVPGNCTAEVILPDGASFDVDAGAHEFSMAFGESGDGIPVLREVS
jgi:alpha-L-rhamnosidase